MIISCPSCTTRYQVDPAGFIPAGRKVRCAKCGEIWMQDPPEEALQTLSETQEVARKSSPPPPAVEQSDDAEGEAHSGGDAAVASRRTAWFRQALTRWRLGQAAGFAGLAAFVGVTLYAVYTFKDDLVEIWPATAALYAALNEPVDVRGIEFQNVTYEHQHENGLPVLAIKGEVINVGDAAMGVPRVRVGLRDVAAQELYAWTFALPEEELAPEQSAEFVTRLSSPPLDAHDLEIRFVAPDELAVFEN